MKIIRMIGALTIAALLWVAVVGASSFAGLALAYWVLVVR